MHRRGIILICTILLGFELRLHDPLYARCYHSSHCVHPRRRSLSVWPAMHCLVTSHRTGYLHSLPSRPVTVHDLRVSSMYTTLKPLLPKLIALSMPQTRTHPSRCRPRDRSIHTPFSLQTHHVPSSLPCMYPHYAPCFPYAPHPLCAPLPSSLRLLSTPY
jgi:hypothetical protein